MISAEVAGKILGVIMAIYKLLANYMDIPNSEEDIAKVKGEVKSWLDTITK